MNDGFGLFVQKLTGNLIDGNIVKDAVYKAVFNGRFLGLFKYSAAKEHNGKVTYILLNIFEEVSKLELSKLDGGVVLNLTNDIFDVSAPIAVMPSTVFETSSLPSNLKYINFQPTADDEILRYTRQTYYNGIYHNSELNFFLREVIPSDTRTMTVQYLPKGILGFRPSFILSMILKRIATETGIAIINDVDASALDDCYMGVSYDTLIPYAINTAYQAVNVPDNGSRWISLKLDPPEGQTGEWNRLRYIVNGSQLSQGGNYTISFRNAATGEIVATDSQAYPSGTTSLAFTLSGLSIDASAVYQVSFNNDYDGKTTTYDATVWGVLLTPDSGIKYLIPFSSLQGDIPFDEAFRVLRLIYGVELQMQNDEIHCQQHVVKEHEIPNYIPYTIERNEKIIRIGKQFSDVEADKELLSDITIYTTQRNTTHGYLFSIFARDFALTFDSTDENKLKGTDTCIQQYSLAYDKNYIELTHPSDVITFEETSMDIHVGDLVYISNRVLNGVQGRVVSIEEYNGRRKIIAYSTQ
jgi:hypothetical protein